MFNIKDLKLSVSRFLITLFACIYVQMAFSQFDLSQTSFLLEILFMSLFCSFLTKYWRQVLQSNITKYNDLYEDSILDCCCCLFFAICSLAMNNDASASMIASCFLIIQFVDLIKQTISLIKWQIKQQH